MIGLLTYHAAYNYGSVLQAYATQEILRMITNDVQIINYRMKEQKRFYSLYRAYFGYKCFLKDLMQFPVHAKRKRRAKLFEDFITNKMNLSIECENYEEISAIWNQYECIVSGSDQIWNKHSHELEHSDWTYMRPYLLDGYHGRKISYASSIGNMNEEELGRILSSIKSFNVISMREISSSKRVGERIGKDIQWVLDPTFLLTSEEWIKRFNLCKCEDNYILYYSLQGIKPLKRISVLLRKKAKENNCKLKIITPFAYLYLDDDIIEMHPEMGPIEFLNAIYNAKMVVTNSYHGTILSVNFGKEVYSLCENTGSEFRKTDILCELGMANRIIFDSNTLLKSFTPVDYNKVENILCKLRENSIHYLKKNIK